MCRAFVPIFLLWKLLERVLGRWARKRPFQRICIFVPWVVLCYTCAPAQRIEHDTKEEDERSEGQECAPAGDVVPVSEGLRIVDVTTWHTLATQEVLWEEGNVCANEHRPEVQLACPFWIHPTRHLWKVKIDTRKDRKDRSQTHHVVEVRHNIVGVVICTVHSRLGQNDAGHAANCEEEQETKRPKHRCLELNRAAPHRGDPTKDLNTRRYRNDHCRQHKVRLLRQGHANGVHVVRPNDETKCTNRDDRPNHWQIAKHWFARERRDDVADDTKAWQDDDVNFRVT